jgi:predicted MFS family arabinose efflux permease
MTSFASTGGARRLFLFSTAARLPLATLGIGLLVHAARVTGSFAAAGLVAGAHAVALGVGGPLAARLVDRRGQTLVLVATSVAAAGLLGAEALVPAGAPVAVLLALAAGLGLATPPVGSCMRAVLPSVIADPAAVRSAFAVEAAVAEITWVAGPPFTLGLAAILSPGAALALSGLVVLVATLAFAALPASRGWVPAGVREARGALAAPGMRTLVAVLLAVGVLFGALEVAVTATVGTPDDATTAAPFLALWGLGSLVGGIALARRGGDAATPAGLVAMLGLLGAGHLALVFATGSDVRLGAALLVAGVAIAPTLAITFALVDDLAPAGTVTEAFAWLATAESVGSALGSALSGSLVEHAGPVAALAFAGAAGALAMATALVRRPTLTAPLLSRGARAGAPAAQRA